VEASKARQAVPAEPTSVGEAFEMLGINPDASTTVVKKIVDGLRQSWHPDHAKDDADRQLREDRMKQINIAWDVISGRRQVA
jgi:DnaJ-class molecular chaperone